MVKSVGKPVYSAFGQHSHSGYFSSHVWDFGVVCWNAMPAWIFSPIPGRGDHIKAQGLDARGVPAPFWVASAGPYREILIAADVWSFNAAVLCLAWQVMQCAIH